MREIRALGRREMKIIKSLTLSLSFLLIVGCAGHRPIVDFKSSQSGKNAETYEVDLKECQEFAKNVNVGGTTAAGAAIGAGVGAAFGAAVYAIFGLDATDGAAFGAAMGGLQGAGTGGASAANSQITIINNCMKGRGYNVLN